MKPTTTTATPPPTAPPIVAPFAADFVDGIIVGMVVSVDDVDASEDVEAAVATGVVMKDVLGAAVANAPTPVRITVGVGWHVVSEKHTSVAVAKKYHTFGVPNTAFAAA